MFTEVAIDIQAITALYYITAIAGYGAYRKYGIDSDQGIVSGGCEHTPAISGIFFEEFGLYQLHRRLKGLITKLLFVEVQFFAFNRCELVLFCEQGIEAMFYIDSGDGADIIAIYNQAFLGHAVEVIVYFGVWIFPDGL